MQLKNKHHKLALVPAPTVTSKSVVYRGSVTVSNKTDITNAKKASSGVDASRVLVAGVLVGRYIGRTFYNI